MVIIHNSARALSPIPTSQKRRSLSHSSLPTDDAPQQSPKKRELYHPAFPPPRFWDGLSTIPLTRNALEELDRKNTQLGQGNVTHLLRTRQSARLRARRPVAEEPAEQLLRRCSSRFLNRVKDFSTHGGPDLSSLRGYRTSHITDHGMRSFTPLSLERRKRISQSPEKISENPYVTTTRSTTPYDHAFHQHLVDHDDIRLALRQRRPSLSPSQFPDDKFEEFQLADAWASKESHVITDVIPFIEGDTGDRQCIARQVPCTNFDHLTDGTLVAASPDIYYGARPEQLQRMIRQDLSGRVVPSTQGDLPIAPNFFVEVKGPDGIFSVAKRQITYDMALGERGQVALDAYLESEPRYKNEAHTLGCTYQDGQLKVYATHAIKPSEPGTLPEYVLTLVKAWSLIGDSDMFREGAAAYRNARDWAKQQRDQAILSANEKAKEQGFGVTRHENVLGLGVVSEASTAETSQATITTHGSNAPSFHDSETPAGELLHESSGKGSKESKKGLPAETSRLRQESQVGRKRKLSASSEQRAQAMIKVGRVEGGAD